jgi:hypothetical protein
VQYWLIKIIDNNRFVLLNSQIQAGNLPAGRLGREACLLADRNGKAAGRIDTFILPISYRPYRTGICINFRILFNEFNSSFKNLIAQRVR